MIATQDVKHLHTLGSSATHRRTSKNFMVVEFNFLTQYKEDENDLSQKQITLTPCDAALQDAAN